MKRKNVSIVRMAPPASQAVSTTTVHRNSDTGPSDTGHPATPPKKPTQLPRSRDSLKPKFFIAGGVLLIGLSLVQLFSTKSGQGAKAHAIMAAQGASAADSKDLISSAVVDASPIVGDSFKFTTGKQTRPNPSVPWLEMVFCRGRQTSTGCSGKAYHPYLRWWETYSSDPKMNIYWKTRAAKAILATFGNGIAEE